MSTKRPSVIVISELIQKFVGSDYDKIKEISDNLDIILGNAGGLTQEVSYPGYSAETLDELLASITAQVTENTSDLDNLSDMNAAIAANSAAILNLALQFEQFLAGKTYQGGYDAATNLPNLESPIAGNVKQGYVFDVTVAGSFDPIGGGTQALNVGDTLRAVIDDPSGLAEWVVIPLLLVPASIKAQYESNADTNEFDDTEKANLETLTNGSNADLLHTHAGSNAQEAYEAGPQITVNDTVGSVIIDPNGSDEAALRIVPVAPFPSANLSSGSLAVDQDGSLYSYDGTRNKMLSVAEPIYHFGRDYLVDGQYLSFQGITSSQSGYEMPKQGTIIGIRAKGGSNESKTFELQRNQVNELEFSLSSGKFVDLTVDIDFNTNDEYNIYVKGSGAPVVNPQVQLLVKWRK